MPVLGALLWPCAAALGLCLSGCSESAQDASSSGIAPTQEPVERAPGKPSFDATSLHKLSSRVTAAGIAARYDAYFDGEQLKAIVESRRDRASGQGEYLFMGARLLEYTGDSLSAPPSSGAEIQLRFDLQGRLIGAVNRTNARQVEQSQIDALRARAGLLRSHALTQRSISAHQRIEEERG